ncbi:Uncharacterized protein Fot_36126 [Forsythia ovata]|uniref:Uncharacterized protein n=1 Tax=Forsythia ovata TaxID=205694 RepID=A0ABD1SNI8_9LAMI
MGCSRGHKCHQFLGNLTYLYCNNIFYESNASVISFRDNLNPNLKELNFSLYKELAKKHGFDLSSLLEKLLKIGILLLDGFALKQKGFIKHPMSTLCSKLEAVLKPCHSRRYSYRPHEKPEIIHLSSADLVQKA